MTFDFDIDAYLERIAYDGPTAPTVETLRGLHRAHHLAVPFENLDIHIGREIVLEEARLLAKIVGERRGGFCYELNGAFAALLRALGFQVRLLSAGVRRPDGGFGPDFDHLLLRVDLDEPWLADVGFGDLFLEPIRLNDAVQTEGSRAFRIEHDDDKRVLLQRDGDGDWEAQYSFSLTPRRLAEFAAMCHFHQTSPESHFTRKRVCSRATPAGRVSLTDDRLIVTEHGIKREEPIVDDVAWTAALHEHFGVTLPGPA